MEVTLDAKYVKGSAGVVFGKYANDRVAIQLTDIEDHCPLCTATVNIPEAQLDAGKVFLKGWSENEGVPQALDKAGIVKLTGRTVPSGFVEADEAELLVDPA